MKNCPCEQCPCIPICRNRRYTQLITCCSLWKKYVNYGRDHMKDEQSMNKHRVKFLAWYNILKPKRWFIHRVHPKYGYMVRVVPEGEDRNDPKYNPQI